MFPGTTIPYIAEKAQNLVKDLHCGDYLIVFGGANFIVPGRNYKRIITKAINRILPIASRTNITINTIPSYQNNMLTKHLVDDAFMLKLIKLGK